MSLKLIEAIQAVQRAIGHRLVRSSLEYGVLYIAEHPDVTISADALVDDYEDDGDIAPTAQILQNEIAVRQEQTESSVNREKDNEGIDSFVDCIADHLKDRIKTRLKRDGGELSRGHVLRMLAEEIPQTQVIDGWDGSSEW